MSPHSKCTPVETDNYKQHRLSDSNKQHPQRYWNLTDNTSCALLVARQQIGYVTDEYFNLQTSLYHILQTFTIFLVLPKFVRRRK